MSLFTEEGIREGTKSIFYSTFKPLDVNIPIEPNSFVVMDGGFLLHKVIGMIPSLRMWTHLH